jgi:hypothetical protein
MRSLSSAAIRIGTAIAFAAVLGCTNQSPTGDGGPPGPVSFRNDLLTSRPGFEFSCGLSPSCHLNVVSSVKTDRVFLGCNHGNPNCTATGDVAQMVYQGLVGDPDGGMVMSLELSSMPYVDRQNPDNSYLVRKLEGTLNDLQSKCVPVSMDPVVSNAGETQPCGQQMPLTADPLPDLSAKVRAWILQGAPDN